MFLRKASTAVLARSISCLKSSRAAATMSSGVRLRLLPDRRCLFDEPVRVKVEGLSPDQRVVLRAMLTDDNGVTFEASGTYRADPSGEVDLGSDASLGGSYTGVEPMGLFWSMRPEIPHAKLRARDVLDPLRVRIEVHGGESGHVLASETNERGFLAEGMRRVAVKEGRIRGVLLLPPGPGPFPGVVEMNGFGGGLCEIRACLLANQGFVVLCLALYGYQDLPKTVKKFDLEYFEEAIMFLKSLPEVRAPGVGVLSISKSGDLALSMASRLTGVSATVCVNSCNANTTIPLHYRGTIVPALNLDLKKVRAVGPGLLDVRDVLLDPMAPENRGCLIPIERADCRFLFAASGDDRNWKSCRYARQMAERLKDHGKGDCEVVVYPEAGHFLEVPYMPLCASAFHALAGGVVMFGGEPRAHAHAQLDLWRRVPEFFRKHLNGTRHEAKL
ncbi:hypothetical protein AAFF_G00247910 [Aldrovandia affinis]|uniref:Acyl-coenzyme A thioesterase 1-like n=1 Tax=Aldrovandia affinis TaxID=143900 RepID=A0AAD7RDW0_9TELE|nr:hypothetical protein AAFF_G00247910 [Aldrovandia affinis]